MEFFLCFIPLFIAIDVVGLLPVYMGLTEGMDKERRRAVVRVACITAVTVAVTFVFLGEGIFKMLGITTDYFRVAGGLLLLIFAIQDLTIGGKPRRSPSDSVAVVPLGMPLLVGPGVLTTSLLLVPALCIRFWTSSSRRDVLRRSGISTGLIATRSMIWSWRLY